MRDITRIFPAHPRIYLRKKLLRLYEEKTQHP